VSIDVRVIDSADAPGPLLAEIRQVLVAAFADFSAADWDHALGGRHVVAVDDEAVVAHAAVVERTIHVADRAFRAGYVEGVAARPDRQHQGLGALVMVEASSLVRDEFELGVLSTGSHGFYERLGWERWRGPSYVRAGAVLERTPDEDDGIMVLRVGPSRDVDLTAPISCDRRPGDDW